MTAAIVSCIFIGGFYPIVLAVRANRKTTLLHAIAWALVAWLFWSAGAVLGTFNHEAESFLAALVALGFTGCASAAVLGARRPGVAAWNFVIIALFFVMIFLWMEGTMAGEDAILGSVRTTLFASTVAIGVLNYLPTRLAPAALMLAIGCGFEIIVLMGPESLRTNLEA